MRRPGTRSLAGGAAGIIAGVIGGIALSSVSAASGPARAAPGPDAVHVRASDRLRPRTVIGERDVPFLELFEEAGGLVLVEVGFLEELAHR